MDTEVGRFTMEELSSRLDAVMAWLARFQVSTGSGRLRKYAQDVRAVVRANEAADWNQLNIRDTYNAVLEAHELETIYSGLNDPQYDGFVADKLRWLPSGKDAYDEEDGNTIARNTAFELQIASRLAKSGLQPRRLGTTDMATTIAGCTLTIECKRVSSPKKVEARYSDAAKQIRRTLDSPDNPASCGLIAMDITRICFAQLSILHKLDWAMLNSTVDSHIHEIHEQHKGYWLRTSPPRLLGFLLRASILAACDDRPGGLIYTERHGIYNVNRHGSFSHILFHQFVRTLRLGNG